MSTFPEEQLDSSGTSTMSTFPEEQLDSPAGYFSAQPGQSLEGGRWTIIRKLGWGPRSSTWLALDNNASYLSYEAIKIFTATATEDSTGNNERYILLLDSVKKLSSSLGIPKLTSYFYEHDTKEKRHLCLTFKALSTSVEDLRLTNIYHGENLPVHVVKGVALRISEQLAKLARLKIIHGAVTPDNFLFWGVERGEDIQRILKQSKNKRPEIQNIVGSDGITYPSVISQPIPHGHPWDCSALDMEYSSIYLSNYAYARPIGGKATSHGARKNLNFFAPEVLQSGNGRIDTKSDVWMFGCSLYLLLTGSPLFSDSYIASPIATARETLGKLEGLLTHCGKIAEEDIPPAASFLRSCLMIKPQDRPSAVEILNCSWVPLY